MKPLGAINVSAITFFCDLGKRLSEVSGDTRESEFVSETVSGTSTVSTPSLSKKLFLCLMKYLMSRPSGIVFNYVFSPRIITTEGKKNNNNNCPTYIE